VIECNCVRRCKRLLHVSDTGHTFNWRYCCYIDRWQYDINHVILTRVKHQTQFQLEVLLLHRLAWYWYVDKFGFTAAAFTHSVHLWLLDRLDFNIDFNIFLKIKNKTAKICTVRSQFNGHICTEYVNASKVDCDTCWTLYSSLIRSARGPCFSGNHLFPIHLP
jgi:hypothetical protein